MSLFDLASESEGSDFALEKREDPIFKMCVSIVEARNKAISCNEEMLRKVGGPGYCFHPEAYCYVITRRPLYGTESSFDSMSLARI